jgi:hypothetical protein
MMDRSREAFKALTRIPNCAAYDLIEAVNQQEAEKQAVEQYKKDKDARLNPRLAEAVDEVEAEDTQSP